MKDLLTGIPKKVICILIAFLSVTILCFFKVLNPYNILTFCIFLGIYLVLFNYKINKLNNKERTYAIILSIIYSLFYVVGCTVYSYYYSNSINIIDEIFTIRNMLKFIALGILFYFLIVYIFNRVLKIDTKSNKVKISNKKIFIISFVVIFVCYIPYFLSLYPAVLSTDSLEQFSQITGKVKVISDHHPVFHTFIMSVPYNITHLLTNNANLSVASVSVFQMILMSSIFSYVIVFLKNRKAHVGTLVIVALFYALSPIFGYYSVTMWKDIIFGCLFSVLIMNMITLVEKRERLKYKDFILFGFCLIVLSFLRNNMIYIVILLFPITLLFFKKYYKQFIILFLLVVGLYYTIKGPIFASLNIVKSSSSEYLAIPIQQIGRTVYKNKNLTKEEINSINKIININDLARLYNPNLVDSIKFNEAYNISAFDANKKEYLKLYLSITKKYPVLALESYLCSTLGYYYPNFEYWVVLDVLQDNEMGFYRDSKAPGFVNTIIDKLDSRNMPIFNMQFSIGFMVWTIMLFMVITILRIKAAYLYCFMPAIGIWLTLIAASPIAGEFRYMFGIFASLPLLMNIGFMERKKE